MKLEINWKYLLYCTIMVICYGLGASLLYLTIGRDATIGVLLIGIGIDLQHSKKVKWYKIIKRNKEEVKPS